MLVSSSASASSFLSFLYPPLSCPHIACRRIPRVVCARKFRMLSLRHVPRAELSRDEEGMRSHIVFRLYEARGVDCHRGHRKGVDGNGADCIPVRIVRFFFFFFSFAVSRKQTHFVALVHRVCIYVLYFSGWRADPRRCQTHALSLRPCCGVPSPCTSARPVSMYTWCMHIRMLGLVVRDGRRSCDVR